MKQTVPRESLAYKDWILSEFRWRVIACSFWYASAMFVLSFLAHFRLDAKIPRFVWDWSIIDRMIWTLVLVTSQVALLWVSARHVSTKKENISLPAALLRPFFVRDRLFSLLLWPCTTCLLVICLLRLQGRAGFSASSLTSSCNRLVAPLANTTTSESAVGVGMDWLCVEPCHPLASPAWLAVWLFGLGAGLSSEVGEVVLHFPPAGLQLPRAARIKSQILLALSGAAQSSLRFGLGWLAGHRLLVAVAPLVWTHQQTAYAGLAPTGWHTGLLLGEQSLLSLPSCLLLLRSLFFCALARYLLWGILSVILTELLSLDVFLLEALVDTEPLHRAWALACLEHASRCRPDLRLHLFGCGRPASGKPGVSQEARSGFAGQAGGRAGALPGPTAGQASSAAGTGAAALAGNESAEYFTVPTSAQTGIQAWLDQEEAGQSWGALGGAKAAAPAAGAPAVLRRRQGGGEDWAAAQQRLSVSSAGQGAARPMDPLELPWNTVTFVSLGALDGLTHALYRSRQADTPNTRDTGVWSRLSVLSPYDKTEMLFQDMHALICAAQALSVLAECSLREDRHGVVHPTLERVICSLLACSAALQSFARSAAVTSQADACRLQGHGLVVPDVISLSTHLDNALYRIVTAFHPHLARFTFPPQYAAQLQGYADFAK
eukprot:g70970.t1